MLLLKRKRAYENALNSQSYLVNQMKISYKCALFISERSKYVCNYHKIKQRQLLCLSEGIDSRINLPFKAHPRVWQTTTSTSFNKKVQPPHFSCRDDMQLLAVTIIGLIRKETFRRARHLAFILKAPLLTPNVGLNWILNV